MRLTRIAAALTLVAYMITILAGVIRGPVIDPLQALLSAPVLSLLLATGILAFQAWRARSST
jgi:hypothetical protein